MERPDYGDKPTKGDEEKPYCPECNEIRDWAGDICRECDEDLMIYGTECDRCGDELPVAFTGYVVGGREMHIGCTVDWMIENEPEIETTEDALGALNCV